MKMGGGTLGHVILGSAFLIIGLWHLFNTIKLHSLHPTSFISLPWFPLSHPRLKYLEPITIITVSLIFISMELFIGRTPTAPDGTIPSENLRHFEHSVISLSFAFYALFAILLHKIRPPAHHGLIYFLQAAALVQQLLIFHFHSTDHMGVEGQYHWLFQMVTLVTLLTTVLAIGCSGSFLNSFVRSFCVVFQGVWLVATGMLWVPEWMPKGCYLKKEMRREAVVCRGDGTLDRAKALVNLEFGFCLILLSVFSVVFYVVIVRLYPQQRVEYRPLTKYDEHEEDPRTISTATF